MDEEEVAKRLAILTEMLLGHPGEVQEDGLRWMLKVTAPIPLELDDNVSDVTVEVEDLSPEEFWDLFHA